MTAYYVYGSAAGEKTAGECLRMAAPGRKLRENAYIVLRAAWMGLKQLRGKTGQ